MIRAIVFDLDDTLYPEREYAFSGFAAVSVAFADVLGDSHASAAEMRRLFDTPNRSRVFNALLAERGLPEDAAALVRRMVNAFRAHRPTIRLFPDAESALARFRGRHKLGLITDGPAVQQWAKIDALGLRGRLDEIIVTSELGRNGTKARRHEGIRSKCDEATERRSDEGECADRGSDEANIRHSRFAIRHSFAKPHPYAFELMSQRLGVAAHQCTYVADNPEKDFIAPNRLGWLSVRVKRASGVYERAASADGGEPKHMIATLEQLDECLALSP